ncbi:expressed unknown protein [Ectocarpus siliculosus]|uniref:Uncharacterized protein n=1 Tax=Ectocarpus siliculosus TaxID=2880 RepID=D8LMH9_ECTSI|nr:expressed unknown protein [Ectocarpus siliculosus]|eukprot:CBN77589.1 expressed unknown protein [Ectocarpus siliculosus]
MPSKDKGKGGSTDKAAGAAAAAEQAALAAPKIIIEAALDWEKMEVEMAHDMSRVDSENKEVESWEAATPGRADRAALLWTQRQASKVASLGNGDRSLTSSSSPENVATSSPTTSSNVSVNPKPVPSALISDEEMKKRADERVALRQTTMEFEKKWEADRVDMVEAGMQEMAMQLEYIRGREESIKQARLPFLRDRETIVQDLIAKMRARKEAVEEERAALEPTTKGGKTKQATKGKPGKK